MKPSALCPQCGRPYPCEPPATLPVTGPVRRALVNIIASRPDGITRDEIMDRLYANSPDAPEGPASVHVLVHLANKQLKRNGLKIWASRGPGARYYLGRIERGPLGQPPA